MSASTKQTAFSLGFSEGKTKGLNQDLGGFFTPYPNNAGLRSEWVKGFKEGFFKASGKAYPLAKTEQERFSLFNS